MGNNGNSWVLKRSCALLYLFKGKEWVLDFTRCCLYKHLCTYYPKVRLSQMRGCGMLGNSQPWSYTECTVRLVRISPRKKRKTEEGNDLHVTHPTLILTKLVILCPIIGLVFVVLSSAKVKSMPLQKREGTRLAEAVRGSAAAKGFSRGPALELVVVATVDTGDLRDAVSKLDF